MNQSLEPDELTTNEIDRTKPYQENQPASLTRQRVQHVSLSCGVREPLEYKPLGSPLSPIEDLSPYHYRNLVVRNYSQTGAQSSPASFSEFGSPSGWTSGLIPPSDPDTDFAQYLEPVPKAEKSKIFGVTWRKAKKSSISAFQKITSRQATNGIKISSPRPSSLFAVSPGSATAESVFPISFRSQNLSSDHEKETVINHSGRINLSQSCFAEAQNNDSPYQTDIQSDVRDISLNRECQPQYKKHRRQNAVLSGAKSNCSNSALSLSAPSENKHPSLITARSPLQGILTDSLTQNLVPDESLFSSLPATQQQTSSSIVPGDSSLVNRTALGAQGSPCSDRVSRMDLLRVVAAERSSVKSQAIEDARQMQASVLELAKKTGADPPKYVLTELIGKGSFGRVYKAKDMTSAELVAVKILNLDEIDSFDPRSGSAYADFMKEVNTLKILSQNKARNINHVIEALPVGTTMWMITEYCGGGSVSTLMRPTKGLEERFIVPILREVAEAVKWVHDAGIIHRDIKCANVLITVAGNVQLCDFGVAAITDATISKRTTFIGTMHWMAPEMWNSTLTYGQEIDIWAFGSMAYEMACGQPPNATTGPDQLKARHREYIPRLEGGNHSKALRDIVAFCLEETPADRPDIKQVQKHPYIFGTNESYPTESLVDLVKAFRQWEIEGGIRKSLFQAGGAQGPSDKSSYVTEWDFATTTSLNHSLDSENSQGDTTSRSSSGDMTHSDHDPSATARPTRRGKRMPPANLPSMIAPLQKLFDPHTITNYGENYSDRGQNLQSFRSKTSSDLPLRDNSAQITLRDTLIDLDNHDSDTDFSAFADADTIRPFRTQAQNGNDEEPDYQSGLDLHSIDNLNRRTKDWKFPGLERPATAEPQISRFPTTYDDDRFNVTPAFTARPALIHQSTEPIGVWAQEPSSVLNFRASPPDRKSLIDLDLSIPEPSRPSTADSSQSVGAALMNPFALEDQASDNFPGLETQILKPVQNLDQSWSGHAEMIRARNMAVIESMFEIGYSKQKVQEVANADSVQLDGNPIAGFDDHGGHDPALQMDWAQRVKSVFPSYTAEFPPLPAHPSNSVMTGESGQEEQIAEMTDLIGNLHQQLDIFRTVYGGLKQGSTKGTETTDDEAADIEDRLSEAK